MVGRSSIHWVLVSAPACGSKPLDQRTMNSARWPLPPATPTERQRSQKGVSGKWEGSTRMSATKFWADGVQVCGGFGGGVDTPPSMNCENHHAEAVAPIPDTSCPPSQLHMTNGAAQPL